MNSTYIKTAVMSYYRFGQRYPYIATEAGHNSGDVVASNGKSLVEIEVKTSKSDFNRDFGKIKHELYAAKDEPVKGATLRWIPNRFYFAVPEDLADYVATKLEDSKYGILVVTGASVDRAVVMTKKAGTLHDRTVDPKTLEDILLRMGSDICTHYIKHELESKMLQELREASSRLAQMRAKDE